MRHYLAILSEMLDDTGLTQGDIAEKMGFKSASAIGMKLRGEREITREELALMCKIAGTTIVELASISEGLSIGNHKETAEIAARSDKLTKEQRNAVLAMVRSFDTKTPEK